VGVTGPVGDAVVHVIDDEDLDWAASRWRMSWPS